MNHPDQTVYWLWIQKTLGCGARIADAITGFADAKDFWSGDESAYRNAPGFGKLRLFSEKGLERLLDKSLDDCYKILALCQQKHITILTPDDERYPDRLRMFRDLPAALYIRGDAACLNGPRRYAVIGARTPTQYSFEAASEIAGEFAENGAVIVSGGAVGIDAAAHEAALQREKPTILVMGCGHGAAYLPENSNLRRRVASCGALVTEYPPLTKPGRGSFQLRNRLISGLSDAVVIIQAGEKSGTLNTAQHAKAQERDLFVLPGSRDSLSFAGSNRLLVEGAKTVINGEDVLKFYGIDVNRHKKALLGGEPFEALRQQEREIPLKDSCKQPRETKRRTSAKQEAAAAEEVSRKNNFIFMPESVSKNAQIVYNILQKQPQALDGIVRASGLSVPQVLSSLTELELAGAVIRDASAVYTCT